MLDVGKASSSMLRAYQWLIVERPECLMGQWHNRLLHSLESCGQGSNVRDSLPNWKKVKGKAMMLESINEDELPGFAFLTSTSGMKSALWKDCGISQSCRKFHTRSRRLFATADLTTAASISASMIGELFPMHS